ncbi:hypothetical protein OEW28_11870 [Defluviimonas sp. WL0002]|uniref:Sulfotransferase family protein n=1 Tax=Albidovulum marisflavi TaxID=2984159 RepID=A0ABT2ZDX7_9RHOB|nr:sulfotransferase [Defluviimonas sp. WL0002]MCV2869322.1 hypothetical protein [Defluviimonas sp. WL0002]
MFGLDKVLGRLARVDAGEAKIFCIGFNKTGTTSLHTFFGRLGLSSVHDIVWPIESHRSEGREHFVEATCYTDGENASFQNLEMWFPKAVFILNTRDEKRWLRSRIKHAMRFGVPTGEPGCTVLAQLGQMGHEFFACPEMALVSWVAQRRVYEAAARQHFSGKPNFLELRVTEDPDWPAKLESFLTANHVPHRSKLPKDAPDTNKRASSEVPDQQELAEYLALADEVLRRIDALGAGTRGATREYCMA